MGKLNHFNNSFTFGILDGSFHNDFLIKSEKNSLSDTNDTAGLNENLQSYFMKLITPAISTHYPGTPNSHQDTILDLVTLANLSNALNRSYSKNLCKTTEIVSEQFEENSELSQKSILQEKNSETTVTKMYPDTLAEFIRDSKLLKPHSISLNETSGNYKDTDEANFPSSSSEIFSGHLLDVPLQLFQDHSKDLQFQSNTEGLKAVIDFPTSTEYLDFLNVTASDSTAQEQLQFPSTKSNPDKPLSKSKITKLQQCYKVDLCFFYERNNCKNGDSCTFAHGLEELRQSQRSNNPPQKKRLKKFKKANSEIPFKNQNESLHLIIGQSYSHNSGKNELIKNEKSSNHDTIEPLYNYQIMLGELHQFHDSNLLL